MILRSAKLILALSFLGTAKVAVAADVNRQIIAEIDPIAPASAQYETKEYGVVTSKWAGNVDFNIAGLFSTGPEFWVGTFNQKAETDLSNVRREDFQTADGQFERHKLDATRLRWAFTAWERPQSMRGYYLKTGYSYTRIDSRANRITERTGAGDAIPFGAGFTEKPDDETDLVSDIRHGVVLGFGNRWLNMNQRLSVTLGASFTADFKRDLNVESRDPDAKRDYEIIIEDFPETKMSVRPLPEVNLSMGYAW
jgi:hypothetical protein